MDKKVYVVLLTWQRIANLKRTLEFLYRQTYKDFTVYISNANLPRSAAVENISSAYSAKGLKIEISHDGNEIFAFRRFTVGKRLAEKDADIVMFIDDDITFPKDYIETCLKQYEEKTYKSGFAWSFQNGWEDYYKYRTRHWNNKEKIHYCGTGISMIDARIFLDDALLKAPEEAYKIEDLWLSYYVQNKSGWSLKYMETPGVVIGGADNVALYKKILSSEYKKSDFLRLLINEYNWKL